MAEPILLDPKFIWGTSINPNSYYRVLGATGVEGVDIYKDVLETGAIRGSRSFAGDAYFAKGAPQGQYLQNEPHLKKLLRHYSVKEVGNNNFFIEATKDFHPDRNPLYKPNATLTHKPLPSIGGVQAPAELAFPNSGSGSRWLVIEDSTGLPVRKGTYVTAAPAENTSFWQRINPANQRYLRMGQAYTPPFISDVKGFEGGAPKWKWLFDYTKDFSKTSIPQHGRNLIHIGRTIMAQPEVKSAIEATAKTTARVGAGVAATAKTTARVGAGVAPFLIDAPHIMYTEDKRRREANAEKGIYEDATPLEKAQILGKGVVGSLANSITLGAAFAGTGSDRPNRGPARMQDAGNEASRRTKERADAWVPR